MLADLLAYQERMRSERHEALDGMAREGQEVGLYEATAGPPPRTRWYGRFPAFLDTCSIFAAYLCVALLRLAKAGTFRPYWQGGRDPDPSPRSTGRAARGLAV